MKDLYIEPFAGISGDMLNAALISIGGNVSNLKNQLRKLHLPEFKVTVSDVSGSSIVGVDFLVSLTNGVKIDAGTDYSHYHDKNDHAHHHHGHTHAHHHGEVRNLEDIKHIISSSELSLFVKEHAISTFERIARAEASVHGMELDEIHFHEVGATDSIVDIVSFFVLLEQLQINNVYCAPVVDGTGTIKVAHGVMPVPVPAVMELRKDCNFIFRQDMTVNTELVTPTGLALLQELQPSFEMPEGLVMEKTGYGFGKRKIGRLNALRVSLASRKHSNDTFQNNSDNICKIEANIDDQSAQQQGYLMDTLLEMGALDVFFTPIQMKKNRPGTLLTVLSTEAQKEELTEIIFANSTTIGVRYSEFTRVKMQRRFTKEETPLGTVHVKWAEYHGIKKAKVEYDDCVRIAQIKKMTLIDVENQLNQYINDKES